MYVTQHYMDLMPEAKKRTRDEEEALQDTSSFAEHRNKRVQCLPLRTSPRSSQQWPHYTSVTPLGSDNNDLGFRSQFDTSPAEVAADPSQDLEVDMMDSVNTAPASTLAPGQYSADLGVQSETSRIPTPMQPSFAAQVRGQNREWAGPGPAVGAPNGIINMGHHQTGFANQEAVPRSMVNDADWQSIHNNRRLPSPISEVEDSMQDTVDVASGLSLEDGCVHDHPHQQVIPAEDLEEHDMEHPNAMMDAGTPPASQATDGEGDAESPSPNRRGHMRSKHTINTWTWQPGMKRSFSIGYRADCEKCRLKVPGHFNHIIIS